MSEVDEAIAATQQQAVKLVRSEFFIEPRHVPAAIVLPEDVKADELIAVMERLLSMGRELEQRLRSGQLALPRPGILLPRQ